MIICSMEYLWIIITLIFSAFFSGTEIAFFSVDKLRMELDRSKGGINSRIMGVFFSHPDRFITTLLLGNNIALVVYGLLTADILKPFIQVYTNNEPLILLLQSIIGTIFILFAGEFFPKIIFRNSPNQIIVFFAPILILVYIILYPFVYLINIISSIVLLILGDKSHGIKLHPQLSLIDLEHYLDVNKKDDGHSGDLDTEVKIIQNAIDFPSLRVRDCMLPRTEVIAIEESESLAHLEQLFVSSGHTKIVVYRQSIDDVLGYIHSSEIFRTDDWLSKVVPALFVPESMYASVLMKNLMAKKKSMAIVIDEMGGTSGIVTLEDIVEEIFGDIEDEHDKNKIVSKKLDDYNYLFSARMDIDDINESFDINLPDSDEYMTLAGFIIHNLQRIPAQGEIIEIDKWRFEIIRSTSTKIVLVKLTII